MAYELELALIGTVGSIIGVVGSAIAIIRIISRSQAATIKTLIETLTNHLTRSTEAQEKTATILDVVSRRLDLWEERWPRIERAVEETTRRANQALNIVGLGRRREQRD